MNYCRSCDIAHEEKNCPLCEAKETIREKEKEIEILEEEIIEK